MEKLEIIITNNEKHKIINTQIGLYHIVINELY